MDATRHPKATPRTGFLTQVVSKMRDESGETIVETLVATLIVTLTFLFLTNAIVTAARINDKIKNQDVSVDLAKAEPDGTPKTVTVSDGHTTVSSERIQKYAIREDDGGDRYAYYEYVVPEASEPGIPANPDNP